MPTVFKQLHDAFFDAIQDAAGIEADPMLSVSQNPQFGDYQSNAAMGLAKKLAEQTGQKTNPRQLAEQIKAKLSLGNIAESITIAGPGFINVKLNPDFLAAQLKIAAADVRLALPIAPSPQRVVVDYSGPNIAKQMHVGHLRSTIIGDAIARVLEFEGDNVVRQNHIGDWGTQFGMLIAYLRTEFLPASGETHCGVALQQGDPFKPRYINDLEEFYRAAKRAFDTDETFQKFSRDEVVKLQQGGAEELVAWRNIVEETRKHYQPIYNHLNVKLQQSDERGESFYNPFLADVVRELKEKKIAVESEGAIVVFVPGYENPLIIQKSDGAYLYGTTDLAAIQYRVTELHANRIIYTHDSRQAQHFAQVFWTAKQAGWADDVSLEYAPFGTMLGEDGKPFKSRSGDTVKLKDLLDEAEQRAFALVTEKRPELSEADRNAIASAVGIGAVKYADLSKDRNSDYVFSWDKMLALEGNTAPYLQYACARIQSIFRKAGQTAEQAATSQMSAAIQLDTPFELSLAKHLLRLPEVIDLVARELKPHHLCAYLFELATKFSSFFENCPVIASDEPLRSSRLSLCDLTLRTLALGLDLLGIEQPERM